MTVCHNKYINGSIYLEKFDRIPGNRSKTLSVVLVVVIKMAELG